MRRVPEDAGGAPPTVLLVGARYSPFIQSLATELGAKLVSPKPRQVRREIKKAQQQVGPLVVVVSSTKPSLLILSALEKVDRLAVFHAASFRPRGFKRRTLRAAMALVDLTIVSDSVAEKNAIELGADPDRIGRMGRPVIERLVLEPKRKTGLRAAGELAASLGLDALELSGFLRLVEFATPDQGVNVVNYHRILPLDEIGSYCRPQMALAEPVFEAQMKTMAAAGFLPVDRLKTPSAKGHVAVTFDDGYEDNFRVALPILERFSVPACVFVATRLIGAPEALWWDQVGLALFAYWKSGAQAPIPGALPPRTHALRRAESYEDARTLISDVLTDLNHASQEERQAAVAAAKGLVPGLDLPRTMLSWDELKALKARGMTIGSHTRNHVPLDELAELQAKEELFGSQADLESELGDAIPRVAALPRGRMGPLKEDDLRKAGFKAVMTTVPRVNRTDDRSLFIHRRDGRMLTLNGRHHPAKLRLELTGVVDHLRTRWGAEE